MVLELITEVSTAMLTGMGMGWRHGRAFHGAQVASQPVSCQQVDELSLLENQAEYLGEALQSINSRISELETETD